MKRLFLAFLLLAMPLAPVGWTGMTCSQNQQRVTYNTLSSLGLSVNSAYAAYNDQVVKGTATFSPTVASAYNKFQASYAVAVAGAQTANDPAPANLQDLANAVFTAINQFKK